MSKGKYNRKRQRAKEKAEQQAGEVDFISDRRWTYTGPAPVALDTDATAWEQEKVYPCRLWDGYL
jgi:hypothetical protein